MTLESWIAFALMNMAYSAPPGPNAAILLAVSSRGGLRQGLAAFGGILVAEIVWAALAILIVTGLLDINAVMPGGLDLVGAAALILLGMPMVIRRASAPACPSPCPSRTADNGLRGAGEAFLVGITNPLAMVFFVSVAPVFLSPADMSPVAAGLFVLAAVLSCACAHAPYLGLGRLTSPRLSTFIQRGCGLVFVGVGAMRLVPLVA